MAGEVVAVATFCDDIRLERGNKHSLMGCYGHELILDEIPAALPRLCVQVVISVPASAPPTSLMVRARLNGDVIGEMAVPQMELASIVEKLEAQGLDDVKRINLQILMGFSPLVIPEDVTLRIVVETEDGETGGGRLMIRKRTDLDPAF